MKTAASLLLVGCGKMGGALLEGALASGSLFSSIQVVDPSPLPERLKSLPHISWIAGPDKIDPGFRPDLVLLAIKPQQIAETLPAYARFKESVFLSIAAGITLARLEILLGGSALATVRAMPNLPASIGRGICGLVANNHVNPVQRALCDAFIKTSGAVVWLDNESAMDAITAISANGPAYIFALCEAMTKAGATLGLPSAMAMRFARETIIGSGALLAHSAESAETLRRAVTSPGGTTEAALAILLAEDGLNDLMLRAITAGAERAKELARK